MIVMCLVIASVMSPGKNEAVNLMKVWENHDAHVDKSKANPDCVLLSYCVYLMLSGWCESRDNIGIIQYVVGAEQR